MKLIFSIITAFVLFFQTSVLEKIRDAYPKASNSQQSAKKFADLTENASGDNTIKAYKAAAQIIEAKFEKGNGRKSMISNGIKSLEGSIKAQTSNLELRVIRLSVQENLPKIVGYNKNMKDDKAFILKYYDKQNSALKQYVREFAAVSKTMTPAEKATLK